MKLFTPLRRYREVTSLLLFVRTVWIRADVSTSKLQVHVRGIIYHRGLECAHTHTHGRILFVGTNIHASILPPLCPRCATFMLVDLDFYVSPHPTNLFLCINSILPYLI